MTRVEETNWDKAVTQRERREGYLDTGEDDCGCPEDDYDENPPEVDNCSIKGQWRNGT